MASLSPLGIDEETIKAASIAAMEAHRNPRPYSVQTISSSSVEIIAFSRSWSENDWVVSEGKDPWGLNDYPSIEKIPVELVKDSKNVLLQILPSLRSVGNVEAAKVNAAFFNKFLSIINDGVFSDQVASLVEGRKKIIFTGHSGAGPIAIFATIWLLEKLKLNKNQPELPHCVTFGSPLAGNYILNHALRRERWADRFIHFVNRYDIVPRLFLSTPSTTQSNLQQILNLFRGHHQFNWETDREIFESVLRNASCVASEAACSIMGSTNMLSETISSFVDLSPYRPFGTYVFCSGNGRFVVVKNADAVLQLLVFSSQLSSAEEGEAVARLSLEQHLSYRDEVSKLANIYHIFKDFVIGEDREEDESGFIEDVLKERALDNLGLSLRARLCILAAREWEKQKKLNQQKLESKTETMNHHMRKLEDYRASRRCSGGIGYYDGFKLMEQEYDFQANVTRLELAGIWDEILELLKKRPIQLPDEFEGDEKWIKMGTEYRRLVEPLDIANYYRHSKGKDSKEYLRPGSRPKRYFYTQRWLQHYEPMNELRGESTFWAVVEELKIKMTVKGLGFEEVKTEIDELYKILDKWYHSEDVNTQDAFLPGSTLVKWWDTLTPNERKEFNINKIINSGRSC